MLTAEEFRAAITEHRIALGDAIAAVAARWEEPVLPPEAPEVNPRASGDAWSPRQAAEHAIGAQRFFAGLIAEAVGREGPAPARLSLASADEALRALDEAAESSDEVLRFVEDAGLPKAAGLRDMQIDYLRSRGVEASKTVEGVLHLFAAHLEDHAQQIRSAL